MVVALRQILALLSAYVSILVALRQILALLSLAVSSLPSCLVGEYFSLLVEYRISVYLCACRAQTDTTLTRVFFLALCKLGTDFSSKLCTVAAVNKHPDSSPLTLAVTAAEQDAWDQVNRGGWDDESPQKPIDTKLSSACKRLSSGSDTSLYCESESPKKPLDTRLSTPLAGACKRRWSPPGGTPLASACKSLLQVLATPLAGLGCKRRFSGHDSGRDLSEDSFFVPQSAQKMQKHEKENVSPLLQQD